MADFLTNLAGRTLGVMAVAEPIVGSRFAPESMLMPEPVMTWDTWHEATPEPSQEVVTTENREQVLSPFNHRRNDFSRSAPAKTAQASPERTQRVVRTEPQTLAPPPDPPNEPVLQRKASFSRSAPAKTPEVPPEPTQRVVTTERQTVAPPSDRPNEPMLQQKASFSRSAPAKTAQASSEPTQRLVTTERQTVAPLNHSPNEPLVQRKASFADSASAKTPEVSPEPTQRVVTTERQTLAPLNHSPNEPLVQRKASFADSAPAKMTQASSEPTQRVVTTERQTLAPPPDRPNEPMLQQKASFSRSAPAKTAQASSDSIQTYGTTDNRRQALVPLAGRTLGVMTVAKPIVASRFAPEREMPEPARPSEAWHETPEASPLLQQVSRQVPHDQRSITAENREQTLAASAHRPNNPLVQQKSGFTPLAPAKTPEASPVRRLVASQSIAVQESPSQRLVTSRAGTMGLNVAGPLLHQSEGSPRPSDAQSDVFSLAETTLPRKESQRGGTNLRRQPQSVPQEQQGIAQEQIGMRKTPSMTSQKRVVTSQERTGMKQESALSKSNGRAMGRNEQSKVDRASKRDIATRGRSKISDYEPISGFEVDSKPQTPTIRVTIGRIEVRAQPPAQQNVPPRPQQARPRPALSLDDYLKQRTGGRR